MRRGTLPAGRVPRARCTALPGGHGRSVDDDRGIVTVSVAVLATSLLLVTVFVVDGGRLLHRYVEAHDLASNAARVAAQEVVRGEPGGGGLYGGETPPRIDADAAQVRVGDFLSDAGYSDAGFVVNVVATDQVEVEITLSQPLLLAGSGSQNVSAVASATAQRGVEVPG